LTRRLYSSESKDRCVGPRVVEVKPIILQVGK
jgi:hypothetical protein